MIRTWKMKYDKNMKKGRLVIFDLLKIILATTIVNFHLESFVLGKPFSIFYYLGWYGVPVFVVISFYFNSKYFLTDKLPAEILIKKVKRLLIPLFFWSAVGFIIHASLITPKYILRQILFGTAVDPPLYYLNIIIIFTIIWFMLGLIKISLRKWIFVAILLISLILEISGGYAKFVSLLSVQTQFFASRFLELVKYASLGSLLPDISAFIKKLRLNRAVFLAMIPLTLLMPFIEVWSKWQKQVTDLGYFGLFQYVVVIFIIIMAVYFQNISLGNFPDKIISLVGKYVIGIYCIHYLFIENLKFLPATIQAGIRSFPVITVILIVILCLGISLLIDKISAGKLAGSVS